jgi:hypothetical protein
MRGALARRDITTAYSTPAEVRGVSAAYRGVDWAVPVRDFRDHRGSAGDLVRPGVYCRGVWVCRVAGRVWRTSSRRISTTRRSVPGYGAGRGTAVDLLATVTVRYVPSAGTASGVCMTCPGWWSLPLCGHHPVRR